MYIDLMNSVFLSKTLSKTSRHMHSDASAWPKPFQAAVVWKCIEERWKAHEIWTELFDFNLLLST